MYSKMYFIPEMQSCIFSIQSYIILQKWICCSKNFFAASFFGWTYHIFQDYLMNRKSPKKFETEIFCNIIHIF